MTASKEEQTTSEQLQRRLCELKARYDQLKETIIYGQRILQTTSWTYDILQDEIFFTDEVYNILNCLPEDLGRDLEKYYSFVHPNDVKALRNAVEKATRGIEYDLDYRIITKQGQEKWVHERGRVLRDQNNEVGKIAGIVQDITELRLLEEELENSYRIITQGQALAQVGSWEVDLQTNEVYWTQEALRIFGIDQQNPPATFQEFEKYIHPDDLVLWKELFWERPTGTATIEFRIVQPSGSVRDVCEVVEFVYGPDAKPTHIYGVVQDVTEQKRLEREIEIQQAKVNKLQRRFEVLIRESIDVFKIIEPDGTITYVSDAVKRVMGCTPQERVGKKIYDFYSPRKQKQLRQMVEEVLANPEKRATLDLPHSTETGEQIHLSFYVQNFLHDPAIEGIVVNYRDITNRVKGEQQILHLYNHDQLTNLPNRYFLRNHLEQLISEAELAGTTFALFMVNLDSLEYIKNSLGYVVADAYIRAVAALLQNYFSRARILARYSEDRFALIFSDLSKQSDYERIAEEIFSLFRQTINIFAYELDVDISIGICPYETGWGRQTLLRNAETALFLARQDGKNNFKLFSAGFDEQNERRVRLRNDLRGALQKEQFRLLYQPLVKLTTSEIFAVEALLRWEHPQFGVVPPNEFIPLAEETGEIIRIGNWVLAEVCKLAKRWQTKGLPRIKISVNFSGVQFFERNFAANILNTIQEHGLKADFLILEITETILVQQTERVLDDLKKLQTAGVKIALDDFGTGYSSFAYLGTFELDFLKIDGSFVRKINQDAASTTITKYMVELGKQLNLQVIAEQIETEEQLNFLTQLNCPYGQGYLFSKPVEVEKIEEQILALSLEAR